MSKIQPLVLRTDGSIKTLSLAFLADLENDWREHGPEPVARVRQQNPTAYVLCVASLAKVMRVEIGRAGEFDRPRDPREVMDRLEQRVGPEGRALFTARIPGVDALHASRRSAWPLGVKVRQGCGRTLLGLGSARQGDPQAP